MNRESFYAGSIFGQGALSDAGADGVGVALSERVIVLSRPLCDQCKNALVVHKCPNKCYLLGNQW